LSDFEKEKMYRESDEIKTIRNEAPIPIGRLRGLLKRIDITTALEFRSCGDLQRTQCDQ
jgi:hypothetical protein